MWIAGQSVGAVSGEMFDRIDPSTGGVASRAPAGRAADAVAAADAAAAAFGGWAATSPLERRRVLMRAAGLLEQHLPAFQAAMRVEIGATDPWVRFNVDLARAHLEEAAALVTQIGGALGAGPGLSMAVRQPAGVCLGIAPWNAPLALAMRAVAVALACGNSVVLKASELSPATQRLVGDVFTAAGLPEGVLNIVTNGPEHSAEVVGALISHPAVRRVNFTGSTRVGRLVAAFAARHLKRCLLELSGKCPLIVLPDADIGAAVAATVYGAFLNQGQICMATDTVIVHQDVADDFVARLVAAASARHLKATDPRLGLTDLGPVASLAVARRLTELIEDARAKGGVVRCGGKAAGTFLDATVIDHVSTTMRLHAEECFGPIVGICRVETVEEAITLANSHEHGFAASVFSADWNLALRVAQELETGICHINEPTVADRPDMPFGGVKASGYGRFGGPSGLDEFTELRWITASSGTSRHPV
ncbi:aldehyde dehydrogenase family protein [bacterium]|nr:aldehyde dehydrogenase family protein [bacterium]